MIDPAKLNRRVEFQRETQTLDKHHRAISTWTTFAFRRAELVTASTEEFARPHGEEAKASLVFRLWHLRDLTLKDRVTYDGRAFGIVDMQEIGFREGLEIRVEAVA